MFDLNYYSRFRRREPALTPHDPPLTHPSEILQNAAERHAPAEKSALHHIQELEIIISGTSTLMTPLTLDQAIQGVTAAEATYNADTASVANIETSIATATAPLAAAQATVTSDVTTYNGALDALIAAATAAKIAA